jgi:hypothetical protein
MGGELADYPKADALKNFRKFVSVSYDICYMIYVVCPYVHMLYVHMSICHTCISLPGLLFRRLVFHDYFILYIYISIYL